MNSYSATKHDDQSIAVIDTRGWIVTKTRICSGTNEEIIGVTSDNNVASITSINNNNGRTKLTIVSLPLGAILTTQTISEMKSKRTPTRAIPANNHNVNTIDNGRRYQGEGINLWLLAIVVWIGWCCLKALAIWSWAQLTYSLHYYGL